MRIIYCLFFPLLFCSCRQQQYSALITEDQRSLDSIPSGSGLVVENGSAYITSDDGTGIYRLNLTNYQQNKISIRGLPPGFRLSKEAKHDLESASIAEMEGIRYLIALGSGSGSAARDSMFMMNLTNFADQKKISLGEFYKKLRSRLELDSTQWNIEGCAIAGDNLFILNRGTNTIMALGLNDFFNYVLNMDSSFPKIDPQRLQLPSINKHEARLSGACTIDNSRLLICASVEDTPDWVSDGPVLGSYIGIYSLKEKKLVSADLLKDQKGNIMREKIESVDILEKRSNGDLHFLAVADNDNGTSKLFRLSLQTLR